MIYKLRQVAECTLHTSVRSAMASASCPAPLTSTGVSSCWTTTGVPGRPAHADQGSVGLCSKLVSSILHCTISLYLLVCFVASFNCTCMYFCPATLDTCQVKHLLFCEASHYATLATIVASTKQAQHSKTWIYLTPSSHTVLQQHQVMYMS